jgi:DNA polymerase
LTQEAPDPRVELAELAAAVRAYVEWQADTGADGLPVTLGEPPKPLPQALTMGSSFLPAPVPGSRPGDRERGGERERAEPNERASPAHTMPTFAAPEWAAAPTGTPPARPAQPVAAAPPEPQPVTVVPAPAAGEGDERRVRLALLAEEVRSCTRCVLHEKRRQTVFARGDPFAELAFVGEGPGADEDALGFPFVGAAGQLLDRMIAAMGYRRDDVYVANIVKCRPPNNRKPEVEEMASCMPFLAQQLGLVKPKAIVALGATAVQGLCGTTEGITRLRGKWKLYKGSIPIMPTFHPAYLLRNPAAKREVWADLQDVMRHLGKLPPAPAGKG